MINRLMIASICVGLLILLLLLVPKNSTEPLKQEAGSIATTLHGDLQAAVVKNDSCSDNSVGLETQVQCNYEATIPSSYSMAELQTAVANDGWMPDNRLNYQGYLKNGKYQYCHSLFSLETLNGMPAFHLACYKVNAHPL